MRRITIGSVQIAWLAGQLYVDHRFPVGWRLVVMRKLWLPLSVREGWAPKPRLLVHRFGWNVVFYSANSSKPAPGVAA